MNELKTEDVMRALEICADKTQTCEDCPYIDHCSDVNKDALALLREKDAEIERLKSDIGATCVFLEKSREEDRKEHDKQMALIREIAQNIPLRIAEARAEAITEFAERLKKFYANLSGKTVGGSVEYHIDQIAKEMREKV